VVFSKLISYIFIFTICYRLRPMKNFYQSLTILIVRSFVLIAYVLKRFFAKYSASVLYFAMYGTVRVFLVRANTSIPQVMRIIVSTRPFFFFLQSSLLYYLYYLTVAIGYPRSLAATRISRPSTAVAPTLLATALPTPAIKFFSIYH
jgi:hypothetical protein